MKRRSYLTTHRGGGLFASLGRLLTAVLGVFVVLLLLLRLVAPGALTALMSPLYQTGSFISARVGNTFSLSSRASLIEDRERLMREVESLRNQNALLTARAEDLERLVGGRADVRGTAAGVLVRPPVSPYDVLIVSRGSNDGVRAGAHVSGPGGVPIGTVTSVEARTSRVTLFSHTGNVIEGWAGEARIPMKLTGTGAGGFDAEIPGTLGAAVGDQVFVPGPGALPIGTITEVVTDPSSPSVVLRIRPLVNPFTLTWVLIEA